MPDIGPDNWALIVDDHPMFCDALELTLQSISEFDSIRNANSIEEAVEALSGKTTPSLVVLDLNLPDATGLDGLTRIVNIVAPAPVIVVSSLTDNRIVTSALKVGASGYVPKHSPRTVFKAAIEAVEQGRIYVPDNFIPTEVPTRQTEALRALSSLTP